MSRWGGARVDQSVLIRGTGVAALTCARLLSDQGWRVRLEGAGVPRGLHLLLTGATASLLAQLWREPDLLSGAHPIGSRMVSWGSPHGAEVLSPGVAIAAGELRRRLAALLVLRDSAEPSWVIDAGPAGSGTMRCFGWRQAWVAPAQLRPSTRDDVCTMAAVEGGWVFLLPIGADRASLQLVAPASCGTFPPPAAAAAAAALGRLVARVGPWTGPFPSMVRIRLPAGELPSGILPGRIAVGEAAAAFDPIGGDGVGHALRGAVLATNMLQATAAGAPPRACLGHYGAMLHRAVEHHMTKCIALYRDAGDIWTRDVAAMHEGSEFLASIQPSFPAPDLSAGSPTTHKGSRPKPAA